MSRIDVAQFLECIAADDELQETLVGIGAKRGFEFTREELVEAEPGVTAEPKTWKSIAGFPDLSGHSPSTDVALKQERPGVVWPNKVSVLAASNVLLLGSLAWSLWRNKRAA